jgi:hypothetical protein
LATNADYKIRFDGKLKWVNYERYQKLQSAREFFYKCLAANAPFVAVENPLPMKLAGLPQPSCYIQPYWFGHKYSKKTLFWLKELPPLMPVITNPNIKEYVHSSRGKYRSTTFEGVARAIAKQWGDHVIEKLNINYHKQKQ